MREKSASVDRQIENKMAEKRNQSDPAISVNLSVNSSVNLSVNSSVNLSVNLSVN